jgi:hypothetical protein
MIGSWGMKILFTLILLVLIVVPAVGDELTSWFATDRRARAYLGVETELQSLFDQARLHKVPIGPLIDKLREGAAKRVEPERLLNAVGETIDQLARARSVLVQASGSSLESEEDVQAVSFLLRSLPEELARELIASGLDKGRDMRAIRAAGDAIASLLSIAELEEGEAVMVGKLLLAGEMRVRAYGSLPSIYLKAKASGLTDREILDEVIIGTLESGGSIASMHKKIDRGNSAEPNDKKRGQQPEHSGPPSETPGQDKDRPSKPPQTGPPSEPPRQEKDRPSKSLQTGPPSETPGQEEDRPSKPPETGPPSEPPGQEKDRPEKT